MKGPAQEAPAQEAPAQEAPAQEGLAQEALAHDGPGSRDRTGCFGEAPGMDSIEIKSRGVEVVDVVAFLVLAKYSA